MYRDFFKKISPQDLIVTPNRRLAAFLRQEFAKFQHEQNLKVWQSPNFLPLNTWLELAWEKNQLIGKDDAYTLLNKQQSQLLWEQIIQQSEAGSHLLRPAATAQMALQAWQLLQQWCLDFNHPTFQFTENSQVWQLWAKKYASICQENHWLDAYVLPVWLTKNSSTYPKQIFYVGFDELTPQHQYLFATLGAQGSEISEFNGSFQTSKINSLKLQDPANELQTMANWAQHLNLQGVTSIGCVIPNLSEIREQVLTIFTEICSPISCLPGYQDNPLPFNISAGMKLSEFPLIQTALSLLSLGHEINLNHLGTLLRSPYLGYAEQEITQRANLDAKLRSYGEPTLSLTAILLAAKKNGVFKFANHLESYLKLDRTSQQAPSYVWAELFTKQLTAWGWPGQRVLDSTEHQLLESWFNLLNQFASLSLVASSFSFAEALQQLQNLAKTQEFQPKTAAVPIQILGLLEAGGLHFEQLWLMGLQDQTWPPAPNPNPFIPLQLQREVDLPHSSANRELNYCRAITQRLCKSANQVILSYPERIEDRQSRPSSLILNAKAIGIEALQLPSSHSYAEIILASSQLETMLDEQGPSIYDGEKIQGGSAIFKYQAACPFRAFARFRLGAQPLDSPQSGLSPQERGSILHSALEALWNQLKDQQTLLSLHSDELSNVINNAIEIALVNFIKKRPLTFRQRFTQLEKYRLRNLITGWLEKEKDRASFTVLAIEQVKSCEFSGIPLMLKTDRVDQLENGEKLIIDYKTSSSLSKSNWLGERLDEPQLPLYCLTSETTISGVLFAQVRSDKKEYIGIAANNESKIPKIATRIQLNSEQATVGWQELVDYWRIVLNQLGQQFSQGLAKADPKDGVKTCSYCSLHALCRINEKI